MAKARGIGIKLALIGEKELKKLLKELPRRVVKKGLRQAANAGANPILKDAKANAPVLTGTLRASVKKKVKLYKTGNAIALIGADRAVSSTSGGKRSVPANYWHLVLGGTRPHAIGKGSVLAREGRSTKEVQSGRIHPGSKPNNFLLAAVNKTASQVTAIMREKLASVLEKEARKLAK